MKNNLFRKFLAVFLTGTLLGAVGCKDYDDDINDLKGQIDDLKGKIELKADASALQTLQSEIKLEFDKYALKTTVDGISAEVDKCLKSNDLAQKLKELGYETSAKIMEEVKGLKYQNAEDVGKLITAQLTEANIWSKINSKVTTEIGEYLKTNGIGTEATNKVLAAVKNAIAADTDLSGIKDAIVNLMGSQFADQMSKYILNNTVAWNNAVSAATVKLLEDAEGDLYKKIEAIAEAATPDLGTNALWLKTNDLETAFAEYDKVADRVAELEGRIQSVVYVPASLDEAQNNTVYFQGAVYIENGAGEKFYLTNENASTATLTFKVSPASKAAEIEKENLSFFAKEVTRAAGDKVTFTVDEVIKGDDVAEGVFKVRITTAYTFSEAANPVAFAMNINIPSANKEENSYGIDYTTAYMGADATQGGKINDNLVVAKKVDDKWVEIKAGATTYETELSYDSKATVTFFDGFKVYYKTTGTGDEAYKLPADLWGTSLKLVFAAPATVATGAQGSAAAYDAANYTFTKTNFKFKAATPVAATIGNVITSGKYKLLATVGTELKDFELFQAEQQVEIIGTTDAYAANAATLAWNYTNATTGSNVYELKNIDMKNEKAMTMAKYQELKAMSYNATPDQVGSYVVTVMKGDADKTADFAVDADSFALSSDPQTDSDPMRVNLKFTIDAKDAAKAGAYTVIAKYCIEAGVYNTISVPLTVKAMPELVAGNKLTPTLSKGYDGNLIYTVADDFTKLIPYVEATHKEAFNDKNTFDTFVATLTAGTSTPDDKAALSLDGKAIKVTFTVPFEFGKAYKPSIVLTSSLVDVTVESTCTLTDPKAKMTPDGNFLTDGVAKTTATLTNAFAVVDKELKDAYSYTGSVQNTTISYEVANEESEDNAAVLEQYKALTELAKTGTIPAVDGSKFLKWNDWNGLSLIIKASLKDNNGIALDTQYFTVKVDNPVKDSAISVKNADATIYAETSTDLNLASLLTLKDMNGKNIFDSSATDGLAADAKAALTGEATYEFVGEHPAYITISDKTLSYVKGSLELSKVVTVKVKVTYKNKFMTEALPVTFDVKVQEGTKPAN